MAARARLIAIVGAECTGKSTLAAALAQRLRGGGETRVAVVGEWLREWCESTGRTPLAHEQGAILRRQHERIASACEQHGWVIADTTALQTAVYSALIFGDHSLRERALSLHARADTTLLTALDLPWQADGHQRDGAHMQAPVDALLREWLMRARLPYAVVHGAGTARVDAAMAALAPRLATDDDASNDAAASTMGRKGLFTALGGHRAAGGGRWWCECCDPEAEAALRRARMSTVTSPSARG
jgi:nicotinamide riboside kinase